MNLNFKEALATLSRALPLVLMRAGVFVGGGFMVIMLFAMLLFASRLSGGAAALPIIPIALLVLGGGWVTARTLERFFLYRHRAAMLFLFSSNPGPAPAAAFNEVARFFPGYASWAAWKGNVRRFLAIVHRGREEFPLPPEERGKVVGLLASGQLSQAVLALAFSRDSGTTGRSVGEGLALYLRHGAVSRALARRWQRFSALGLALLFFSLAAPNWFLFRSAGAPVWIGVALAAAIAWLLHQAFIVPFALAGVSAALLAATRDRIPDPELCARLAALLPDAAPADKR
jgi:hypothetical protein